jgi:hypothetical protein
MKLPRLAVEDCEPACRSVSIVVVERVNLANAFSGECNSS